MKLFVLTHAASYAIQACVILSKQESGTPLPSREIAASTGIPPRFLLKVLKQLVNAGMLHSYKGPGGGFMLAQAAKDITVLAIVEAIEGPIANITETPDDATMQSMAELIQKGVEDFRATLRKKTLADFK